MTEPESQGDVCAAERPRHTPARCSLADCAFSFSHQRQTRPHHPQGVTELGAQQKETGRLKGRSGRCPQGLKK